MTLARPRAAIPTEAAALARLHDAIFPGAGWDEQFWRAAIAGPRDFLAVIGPEDSALALCLARAAADEAEILTMGVTPDARGQGLGHAVLTATLQALKAAEIRHLFLDVREDNGAARQLYHREKFRDVGRRDGYYADGCAAILMARAL